MTRRRRVRMLRFPREVATFYDPSALRAAVLARLVHDLRNLAQQVLKWP